MEVDNLTERSLSFTSNVFLVSPSSSSSSDGDGRTVLVDAGNDPDVIDAVHERTDSLDAVVLTHTHPDHVGQLGAVKDEFDVECWGFDGSFDGVDHEIDDGDTFEMAGEGFDVLHTPGHKDDHVCLYSPDTGVLFSGDLVFAGGSFGRTDLDEGDPERLVESIERLLEHVDRLEEMHAGHQHSVYEDVRRHVEASLRNARSLL